MMKISWSKHRLPILVLLTALFVNLFIVAVYPVGEGKVSLWRVAVRTVAHSIGLNEETDAQNLKPENETSQVLSDRRSDSPSDSEETDTTTAQVSTMSNDGNAGDEKSPRKLSDFLGTDNGTKVAGGSSEDSSSDSERSSDAAALGDSGSADGEEVSEQDGTVTPVNVLSPTPKETPEKASPEEDEATPTLTPLPDTRTLALGIVSVNPGQSFAMDLLCDDARTVAGFDVSIDYPGDLINIVSVKKTALTVSFMLLKQVATGKLSVSVAGVEPIEQGRGILISFEGVVSASAERSVSLPLRFMKAKMYDIDSKPLPLVTQDGILFISGDGSGAANTPQATSTLKAVPPTSTPTVLGARKTPPSNDGGNAPTATPEDWDDEEGSGEPFPQTEPTSSGVLTRPTNTPTAVDPSSNLALTATSTPFSTVAPTDTPENRAATTETLRTDMNKDGRVDSEDLFLFVVEWEQETQ